MPSTYHRLHAAKRGWARSTAKLLLAASAALALCAAAAGAAPRAAGSTLLISGAGEGHGVGMSQDGALGLARHGWSYQQILAHYYTGTTVGQAAPNAVVRVLVGTRVKKLALERYVRGVVAAEMPSGWPLAALEAQAVASRSYALTAHAGGSRFDVYSDTRSQVYMGAAAETAATNTAVAATAGQIVLHGGQPAATYFFASSGGMTENNEYGFLGSQPQPWLRGVADPYNSGPSFSWRMSISFAAASSRLRGLVKGAFRGIEVLRRGVSPRIVSAAILGSAGVTPVSGSALAERLGLSSTWAYFSVKSAHGLRTSPDRSGQASPPQPPETSPSTLTPSGPQGGAQAPGAPVQASSATTGGALAG
jgi:stage II sporulation protein D